MFSHSFLANGTLFAGPARDPAPSLARVQGPMGCGANGEALDMEVEDR